MDVVFVCTSLHVFLFGELGNFFLKKRVLLECIQRK